MGILRLPVREQTCLRLLLWFALQLMLPLKLKLRLMLVCIMEDMDMVLVLDMLASAMLVLAMLYMVMDTLPMDIPPLNTMARDLLMPSQKLRLMPDSIMEDMDMVLDMQVLDMLV